MREQHPPTLRFLGATDTVTGSRYLVRSQGRLVLVDCGIFQVYKRLRDRNRVPFPVNPANIDAVVLTHAHLDPRAGPGRFPRPRLRNRRHNGAVQAAAA